MFSYAKKILSVIGIGLLAGCAASGPTISTPVRPGAAVAAPAYQNGDQWTYQIVRSTGDNEQIRISYRNGKFEHDNPTIYNGAIWAIVYRTDGDLQPLSFPLTPGKSWSYRYHATDPRGRKNWRDAEVKVVGPTAQPIKTPAGQFKAVEIQRFESWGRAQRTSTYFYSPDTKSVVKLVSDNLANNQHYELELIKFSPGR
ncbi:MAG TPA: hypothetical protein VEG60_05695 [Candidatus Binatia bacterium]|nr:hypothetical protein [Candidatus Binatia bacterium]